MERDKCITGHTPDCSFCPPRRCFACAGAGAAQDKLWGVESLTRGEDFALVRLVPVWSFSGEVLGEREDFLWGNLFRSLGFLPHPSLASEASGFFLPLCHVSGHFCSEALPKATVTVRAGHPLNKRKAPTSSWHNGAPC